MEWLCATRMIKNARFLQSPKVGFLPRLEPLDGFQSLVPAGLLRRLHSTALEDIGIERLARAISKNKPPRPAATAITPLFSGTLKFVQTTFSSDGTSYSVPDSDVKVAVQYAGIVAGPISEYVSQYGPNMLSVDGKTIPFRVSVTGGKYNDGMLSQWVNGLARTQRLGSDSCLAFLNPRGMVNTDADIAQGVGGYHSISSAGVPYIFVNVLGVGLTLADEADVYALALSHEIGETIVDPRADGSNPEVCDECLPPYEVLLGDNKPIGEYEPGSTVIGQDGLQVVTEKFVHQYEGELLEIKALGMLPFHTTPNHPILAVHGLSHGPNVRYQSPVWIEAGKLQPKLRFHEGDYLVMPRLRGNLRYSQIDLRPYLDKYRATLKQTGRGAQPHSYQHLEALPLNTDTAWMLGVYVAEGNSNPAHRSIEFSLGSSEVELIRRLKSIVESLDFSLYTEDIPGEKGIKAIMCSVALTLVMPAICGRGASNKRIPDAILFHSDERVISAFLEGYQSGDGSKKNTIKGYEVSSFTTTSKTLAYQLQLLYGRLGIFLSLRRERPAREGFILGRHVKMKESYTGNWCSDIRATRRKRLHGKGIDEAFYLPVKWIRRAHYSGAVHNLGTLDHTYLVSNVVVHNCAGNCNVDYRNYFDSSGTWLGGSPTPGYYFFVDGIATPATVAQCPSPAASCSYPPPKPRGA